MRRSVFFLPVIAGISFITGCGPAVTPAPHSVAVLVLRDTTDSFLLRPTVDPIMRLYEFGKFPDAEARFDAAVISDRLLNPVVQVHLADGETTSRLNKSDDPQLRTGLIRRFKEKVGQALTAAGGSETGAKLQQSVVWETIFSRLGRLAKAPFQTKVAIILSDLNENAAFSVYRPENRRLLETHPEEVAALLEKGCRMPASLAGVHVFFCFRPQNRADELTYLSWIACYRLVLGRLGAVVTCQAQTDQYHSDDE